MANLVVPKPGKHYYDFLERERIRRAFKKVAEELPDKSERDMNHFIRPVDRPNIRFSEHVLLRDYGALRPRQQFNPLTEKRRSKSAQMPSNTHALPAKFQ